MANSKTEDPTSNIEGAIEIKRLEPAQVEDYKRIRLSALETSPDAFGSTYAIEASRPLAHHADRIATTMILGAYEGDKIVGMIGFRQESGLKDWHKGFVWGFFVEPSHRRRGVGSGLIGALLENVRDSVEQVTLSVVADGIGVIVLYERFGFRRYGLEPRALKTADGYLDEVLMVCIFLDNGGRT